MNKIFKRLFKGWDDLSTKLIVDILSILATFLVLSVLFCASSVPAGKQRVESFRVGSLNILDIARQASEMWLYCSLSFLVINHFLERQKRQKAQKNG